MTPCVHTVAVRHGTVIPTVDVIIDPGHGGEEAGAVAYGLREADVNLEVARCRADRPRGVAHQRGPDPHR